MERINNIEVDGRKFHVRKFNARMGLRVSKLLIAKLLPVLDTFLPSLMGGNNLGVNLSDTAWMDEMLNILSLDKIANALDLIEDSDLDKLINYSLSHCYELLPAGPTQVLKQDGTYGVADVEDDMLITLRLIAESIQWSVRDFFDGKRWSSIFKPMADSFQLSASM